MIPQRLATIDTDADTVSSRILVAINESDPAARALRYVGTLLRDTPNVYVTLFHVLRPMPRELLEHGGSEDPRVETRLADNLKKEQEDWIKAESFVEYPILVKALEVLGRTGFPLDRVTLKFGREDDIARNILNEARNGGYNTIVVTLRDSNGLRRLFGRGVTDKLLRDASGFTLWVVE